jgi:hypothetical protein
VRWDRRAIPTRTADTERVDLHAGQPSSHVRQLFARCSSSSVKPPTGVIRTTGPIDVVSAEVDRMLLTAGLTQQVSWSSGVVRCPDAARRRDRRREIGLRRAIGATRRHIRLQFLTEAVLLSALGGLAGAGLGAAVSTAVATGNGWVPVIPPWILVGGVLATIAIGAVAGLYPAVRAARTPPSVALSS